MFHQSLMGSRHWIGAVTWGYLYLSSGVALAADAKYRGDVQNVEFSASECSKVFADGTYDVTNFMVGPTHRTSVLYFESVEEPGFFHAQSVVGRIGGSNDGAWQKAWLRDGRRIRLDISGLISDQILLVDVVVKIADIESGEDICQAKAEFAAFARDIRQD